MKTIYKYEMSVDTMLLLNHGATFLTVGKQNGKCVAWFELENDLTKTERHFRIYGTGHDIPLGAKYCGTFMDEPFVWHFYEVTP